MKKQKLLYSGGATGAVLLPQVLSRISSAPVLSDKLPAAGCTGSCGNCGGSCISLIIPLLFLSFCAYRSKQQ